MVLFDYMTAFWQFWLGSNFTDTTTIQLLSAVCTIAFVYAVVIRPLLSVFRGKRR